MNVPQFIDPASVKVVGVPAELSREFKKAWARSPIAFMDDDSRKHPPPSRILFSGYFTDEMKEALIVSLKMHCGNSTGKIRIRDHPA